MPKRPKIGDILNCEDGAVVVVREGTTVIEGLQSLLEEGFDYQSYALDNPALVAAEKRARVERWFFCTRGYREDFCEDPDGDWWAPDGDGKTFIWVCWYDGSGYDLDEEAHAEAEAA